MNLKKQWNVFKIHLLSEILYSDTRSGNNHPRKRDQINTIQGFITKLILQYLSRRIRDDITGVFLHSRQEAQIEAAGELDGLKGHRWRVEGESDWENDLSVHQ